MSKKKINAETVREQRRKASENQATFWRRYGVTQSGGSRYEDGRSIPRPLQLLMALHATGKITEADLQQAGTSLGI